MSKLTDEQKLMFKRKLDEWLDKYDYLYSPEEVYSIKYRFLGRSFEEDKPIDILDEIYQEIGVFDIVTDNIYSDFYKVLTTYFDINQRLLEVGCGILPSFASTLVKKQEKGTLTIMDPAIRIQKSHGFTILREYFTKDFDISNFDLIYGIKPCDATLDIIRAANQANKDLCILPCKCAHYPYEEVKKLGNITFDDWHAYLEEVIKYTLPANHEFIKEEAPSINYPIYITRKLTNK